MDYNILNTNNGHVAKLTFKNIKQVKKWLENNKSFKNLGPCEQEFFTRHERMKALKHDQKHNE